MKTKTLILVCILAVAGLASGCDSGGAENTYYVDCSASSNGSGSLNRPWSNLEAVNETTFGPGDSILLRRGTTCDGTLWPKGSGVEGSPIVVDAYDDGDKPHVRATCAENGVYLYNQEYWEIRNLEVSNDCDTPSNDRRGIHIHLEDFGTGTHYRILNNTVHDVAGEPNTDNPKDTGGIIFRVTGSSVESKFSDAVVEGNTVYSVDRSGYNMGSSYWCRPEAGCAGEENYVAWDPFVVRDNTLYDIGGDALVLQYASGSLVEYNVAYDIQARSSLCNAGIWPWNADDVVFQHNEAHHVRLANTSCDGQGFDIDYGTRGTIMQYNYSHDNEGGFMLICTRIDHGNMDGVVRYNVSQNDAVTGQPVFELTGNLRNTQIYNNTIYVPEGHFGYMVNEANWGGTPIDVYWANNIFYSLGNMAYALTPTTTNVFDHNLFYGNHDASEPYDAIKITDDPLLVDPGSGGSGIESVDGYQLQAGSPAIASGKPVPDNGGQDYWGNPIPADCPPDRGAHQFAAVCITPVPTKTPDPNRTFLENPGFESGELDPWVNWYVVDLVEDGDLAHSGDHAVALGLPGSVEQDVVGLRPETAYLLSGWARAGEEGGIAKIGVTGHEEGEQLFQVITSTTYVQVTVAFTTGADVTLVTVFCRHPLGGAGTVTCDDFELVEQP